MLNVAYTRYVNTLITIAVIIVSSTCVVQRTLCDIVQSQLPSLPQHPHATILSTLSPPSSSAWGAAGRGAIKSSSSFRNRRSNPSDHNHPLTSCDPVGWLDYADPKFECNAWRRWGYNSTSTTGSLAQTKLNPSDAANNNDNNHLYYSEHNRICIPLASRCNFIKDCPDGSDELNCYATRCESEHDFLCESDLTCIPRSALCDGRFDCSDQSDELSPHLYCHLKTIEDCDPQSGLIPCDGKCLPNQNICDGRQHCSSGIDESYVVCHYTNFSSNRNVEKEYRPCGLKHFECWEPLTGGSLEQPQCIEYEHVCDGVADCSDASDEKFCSVDETVACEGFVLLKNCANSEGSLCKYPDGGTVDTSGMSNDVTCPFELCPTDHQGSYSLEGCNPVCTVPTDRVCRWDPYSLNRNSPYYSLGMASSSSETSLQCVHFTAFCNSSVECSNEADEFLCGILECDDPSQFHCGGVAGQCIDSSRRCDGFGDCWNSSDEEGCTHKESHCSETQFFCPYQSSTYTNGRCVLLQDACNDNLVPCYDNIHLQVCRNLCSSNPGFCPADAKCQDSKSGPLCDCMAAGYVYDYDYGQCVDFDECNANVTKHAIPCDQKCTNTDGSFSCSCYPGYFLDSSDNSTCVAEDQNAFMLVTDLHLSVIDLRPALMTHADSSRSLALSSSVDSSSAQTSKRQGGSPSYAKHFLNISYPPTSVKQNRYISFAAFDYRLRIIYFADRVSNSIYKVKLPSWNLSDLDSDTLLNNTSVFINGSARSEMEKSLISEGMAVDYSSGNLYWIERAPFTQIHVISPDAKHALSLVTQNLSQPREISLHTPKRLLFWVDWGTDTIERCNFDGTERKVILANDRIDFINSIHVDEFSDYIYFLDAKHDAIEFVRMDGTNRGYLLKGENPVVVRPFSITMFESTVYWSDWGFGAIGRNIHKCNKLKCHSDKSQLNGTYYGSLHLTLIHKTMQDLRRVPSYSCLTNNGDCGEENFCLPLASNPGDLGRTHACYRPVILTVPANTTTNSSDADSMDADDDFDESKKNEIAKCKSQTENCLPSTRMTTELQRQSKDENYIQYMCYCGPLSEKLKPNTGDFSEDLPKWLWFLIGAMLLIVATFVIFGALYFCCERETPKGVVLTDHHKKVSKIETLSDGRSNTNYGNPVLNPQGFINGVGTSPHPSPACEAIEMAQHFTFDPPKTNGVCSSGNGGKEGHQSSRRLPDFQAQQPQQSAHAVVCQRTPSFGQSPILQSIPEECSDDSDDEEEDHEEECEEDSTEDRSESCALTTESAGDEKANNSALCYDGSVLPRNYSIGGSSTTALIYPSDDEVFTFDNNDENNLACSKV